LGVLGESSVWRILALNEKFVFFQTVGMASRTPLSVGPLNGNSAGGFPTSLRKQRQLGLKVHTCSNGVNMRWLELLFVSKRTVGSDIVHTILCCF
jgi:hypothetical protein